MRTFIIIFLGVCFLTLSCKKDEPDTYTVTKYYQGILYDSISGNVLPGKTINFLLFYRGNVCFQEQLTTNSNGEFSGSYSWEKKTHPTMPFPDDWWGWVCTSFDTVAGYHSFNNNYFQNNSPLQLDIYARPNGYFSIYFADTCSACTLMISQSVVDCFAYGWSQNSQMADSTIVLKVYGNDYVKYGFPNFTTNGPFVPSNDTIYDTVRN